MTVGDKVPSQTMTGAGPKGNPETVCGICVYIHPKRRYYTLEFNLPGGKVRENYQFKYRRGETSNENNINCQP
ncbi:MAG: hypothetical protein CVU91_13465 [Firmicutes bacterium HGW-Firmicutes-16]|nr:MAG: hypothetical protein CVU91_13465 [Firmicutes bacterium HGW-Firmicutes-16]